MEIHQNVSLKPLTTFDIGGDARYFTSVENINQLKEALQWAKDNVQKFVLFAGGSNCLVDDKGFDGLVIHIANTAWKIEDETVVADAGCNLLEVIKKCSEQNFGGWEKMAGIPGTIGGAIRGNAGAFGTEIKDVILNVEALHSKTGEEKTFTNAECMFTYRNSFFKRNPEWIILSATIQLLPIDSTEGKEKIEATIAEREKRHLQNVRAAGSFFMNPIAPQHIVEMFEKEKGVKSRESRVPAGWLIEKAGMKGAQVGDAMASLQHPNYLVNIGYATSEDVLKLAERIVEEVRMQFDIELQPEAAIL